MKAVIGGDGNRAFLPAEPVELFLLQASVAGLALLGERRELSDEHRFSYDLMRLVFQWAPSFSEYLNRAFLRRSDLFLQAGAANSSERSQVLPDSVGLDELGNGQSWYPSELIEEGRRLSPSSGASERDWIRLGLFAAARLNPILPDC